MSDLDDTKAPALRPSTADKEAWRAYWEKHGQPWRTEPEIDTERQQYLDEHRQITPDIKEGIYPFKDIKLTRAVRLPCPEIATNRFTTTEKIWAVFLLIGPRFASWLWV